MPKMRNAGSGIKKALLLAAVHIVCAAGVPVITSVFPEKGSTEGGTYLVISGSGFNYPTEANPWDSQVVYVGAKQCDIVPHFTSATQIVCLTSPSGTPFESSTTLQVMVQVFSGLGEVTTASQSAAYQYNWWNTPAMHWAENWAGTGGDLLAFAGDMSLPVGTADQFEIQIGDARCGTDQEAYPLTQRRRRGKVKQVQCRLPSDSMLLAGHYNMTMKMRSLDPKMGNCPNSACFPTTKDEAGGTINGYGAGGFVLTPAHSSVGRFGRVWGGTVDLTNGRSHHFTVYPQVNSIEPSTGSIYGGNNLTIHGSSFSEAIDDNSVTIGGLPCEVLEASNERLVCRLGDRSSYSGDRGSSLRGLYYAGYRKGGSNRRRRAWSALDNNLPAPKDRGEVYQTGVLKARLDWVHSSEPYSGQLDNRYEDYLREMTGFFVPPLSANYSFYIAGDDTMAIEIGEDNGVPSTSMRRVASMPAHVPYRDYADISPFVWYYRADGNAFGTPDCCVGSENQISEPIYLSAGQRYPFRMRHGDHGWSQWTRIGLRVGGLSSATRANGTLLGAEAVATVTSTAPSMELQVIRLSTNASRVREMHFVELANASQSGFFRLRLTVNGGQYSDLKLATGIDPGALVTSVRDAKVYVSGSEPSNLQDCRSVRVTTNDTSPPIRRFTIEFDCPLKESSEKWVTIEVVDAGPGGATAGLIQAASAPLSGTFRVGHSGTWSDLITARSATTSWTYFASKVSSVGRDEGTLTGELELECWKSPNFFSGNEAFQYFVRFRRPLGDVAELELDLSGMKGVGFVMEVITLEDGDADAAFLERVPADYFEVPYPEDFNVTGSQVRVVTNGILGGYGLSNVTTNGILNSWVPPSYSFNSSLSPVVYSVSPLLLPANGTMTLIIANILAYTPGNSTWTQDLRIILGDGKGRCEDIQDLTSSGTMAGNKTISCKLVETRAGVHDLQLTSVAQGLADPSQDINVTVEAILTSVSPTSGSLAGGTALSLTGIGLDGMPCSDVAVGGLPCSEPSASGLQVSVGNASKICLTPALAGFDTSSDPSTWTATESRDITLLQPEDTASVVRASFTYASASTPQLSLVSPAFVSAALSRVVVLSGTLLSGGQELPVVRFGERSGTVTSQTDSQLEIFLQRAAPTPPAVAVNVPFVWVPGRGFAAVPSSVIFEARFEVRGITPSIGSKAGGALLTITGSGFHPTMAMKHSIQLELPRGVKRTCEVVSGSDTELKCRVVGGTLAPASTSATIMGRRLTGGVASAKGQALQCERGAADHSKGRCFARALASSGTVRSLPAQTAAGNIGHGLAWLNAADDEGAGVHEPPADFQEAIFPEADESVDVEGPATEWGEAPRRLSLEESKVSSDALQRRLQMDHSHDSDVAVSTTTAEPALDNLTDVDSIVALSLNGVRSLCTISGGCEFQFSADATPTVMNVNPVNGSYTDGTNVTVTLVSATAPSAVLVFFGAHECTGSSIAPAGDDHMMHEHGTTYLVTVPLCAFEASLVAITVMVDDSGYALKASPYSGADFSFQQELRMDSITPQSGSFYGGTQVTIRGAGFGATLLTSFVIIGKVPCEVISTSHDSISCYVPAAPDELADADADARTQDVSARVISPGGSVMAGLHAEYYYFQQGSSLPNLDNRVPSMTRCDATVNFPATSSKWEGLSSSTQFAVRWTGFLFVTHAGLYTFVLSSDEGSKLFVGGTLVIDHDGPHGFLEKHSLPVFLDAGPQFLHVLYMQSTGTSGIVIRYQGPDTGGQSTVLPASALSHSFLAEVPPLSFTYDSPTNAPTIHNLTELPGGIELELIGVKFGSSTGLVALGTSSMPSTNLQCAPSIWNATYIRCTRPATPAGAWQVRVYSAIGGWSNPAPFLLWVDATLTSAETNGATIALGGAPEPWLLAMKISSGGVLGYDSPLWTNSDLLNEGTSEAEAANAKYQAFLDKPFRKLRLCVGGPRDNCVIHTFGKTWPNASALFSAGEVLDATVDQAGLLQALAPPLGSYKNCPMMRPGFNIECLEGSKPVNQARWGWCANCPSQACAGDAGDADATIGIGLKGQSSADVGAGWTAYFASGSGTCAATSETHRDVWLWVEDMDVTRTAPCQFPRLEAGGIARFLTDCSGALAGLKSGYGGGINLTLFGTGLGFERSQTQVKVCGELCPVVASSETAVTCTTPERRSLELIEAFPKAFQPIDLAAGAERFYTDMGEQEADLSRKAFTSSINEQVDLWDGTTYKTRSGCWFGFELPTYKQALVTSVEFFPPTDPNRRTKVAESVFEVRNLTGNTTWTVVGSASSAVVTGATIAQGWTVYPVGNNETGAITAQAFRIRILPDACNSAGELMRGIRFRGIILDTYDVRECPIELAGVSHPLASADGGFLWVPMLMIHSLDRTPVIYELTPNRGAARGDTSVTVIGTGLQPLDSDGNAMSSSDSINNTRVDFNGYSCVVASANDTAVTCVTVERTDGITPFSTEVFIAGRGRAFISGTSEATTFKYVDKWSDVHSWLDSEPPVDGDTVIIPEGQAIMLDVDSPKLFLLLVSGFLEFERKDLALNATYIWIAGGEFQVGTEEAPFLHRATITLHGDRWWTIELPVIGSKMLAVTNLGGLQGGCHTSTMRLSSYGRDFTSTCPVRKVGKLDIHGKPGTSWTRLVETASAGATLLKLEESVDWEVGARVLITQSQNGETEEVRLVKGIQDNGFTLELDLPLEREHLGIWYFNDEIPTPTDVRAAVGLLTRNVKVQGDDASERPGNAYMFGVHMGCFHGGELRVENTEVTRSGQAANLGRYSSHWHHMSPGRTIDVADKAYLRNNSYHDTFQRAVVCHSTDYCMVQHNIAHRSKGHSFFTEEGQEHFALFEHNLAVSPQQHPLLLDDDMDPAGFWLPGFTGWHRHNLAVGCHRGWRLRVISDGKKQTDLTFFNNSAHACGFGWHLKPPHAPPTLNTFKDFTVFRCSTGMFYYGTGNIFHDNHRFLECGTGHFMNHLSNNLHTAPFYHNLYLVGNIAPDATTSRSGLGIRAPKDNEYFYVSGMTVINYFENPVLYGCFQTACTMRFEKTRWFNSTKRTRNGRPMSGIYHDMDGTMTGFPNGFVTWDTEFSHFPGKCEIQPEHVGGVVCGKPDGSVRMRRMLVDGQEPWQLDGKKMRVFSSAGYDTVDFDFMKLYGWPVIVVENETYDIRPEDANDFQKISLDYGTWPYVLEEHGYLYTKVTPIDEAVIVHINYTDWRDHFDSSQGPRLNRMPTRNDTHGAHSMILKQDQCDLYNLSDVNGEKCGVYVNDTTWDLKAELDESTELPQVNGRLSTVITTKVINNNGTFSPGPGTPNRLKNSFIARECPVAGCPTPIKLPPGEMKPLRLWSNPLGWPDRKLPVAMDSVVLASDDNVLLDIVTPTLYWLTIEGRLEFSRTVNTTLNAHSLKVWGTLEMGTTDNPIPPGVKAEIALHGDETAKTVIMTEGLYLVNKVIAVLGTFSAAGSPVADKHWTRLVATAAAGATTLTARGNLSSWQTGAQVAISATEFPLPPATTETEVRTLASRPLFDASANLTTLVLTTALQYRHFAGVVDSSAENLHWPNPTLSSAIALLDGRSNVILRTAEIASEHGGELVIAGTDDGKWVGQANISNVDFLRMGKFLYQSPALKFNFLGKSKGKAASSSNFTSRVERCVFSRSQSGAIQADGASRLEIVENVFHKTYRSAVWIGDFSVPDAIVIRKNIALETLRHPLESTSWVRNFASFLIEIRPKEIVGNIAAGSTDTGFLLRPRLVTCAEGDVGSPRLQEEDLNEAVACMTGVFILRACQGECDECAEVRGFMTWKNSHAGLITVDQSSNMRIDTLLVSDNHIGITLNFHRSFSDMTHRIYTHNVTVFGSTDASTCAASTECRALGRDDFIGEKCNSVIGGAFRRVGIMTHMVNHIGKLCEANSKLKVCRPPTTPVKTCVMPWEHRLGTAGSRYSEAHWADITFGHFAANDCGRPSVAFTYNPTNIDVSYPQIFSGVKWLPSMEAEAKVFMGKSTITGNRVSMAPEMDGTSQMVLTDVDGSLVGTVGVTAPGGSVVNIYNPALAIAACKQVPGFFNCPTLKLRYLKWEAVDDLSHRVTSKFKAWRQSDGQSTWSTGPMNDGCIPDPPEADRGWFMRVNDLYNLTLFTSPPKHHRLFFFNDDPDSIRLDIFLTQPFRLEVYVDGSLLPEKTYDTAQDAAGPRLPKLTDPHGAYTFDPHSRRFYLIMKGGTYNGRAATVGGGFVLLRMLQVVQLSMTVSVPLAQFDGPSMISNLATLLQIDPSRIKIVSVQTRAQVGGRRLSGFGSPRSLQAEELEVLTQIVEKNPAPVPGDAFASAGLPKSRLDALGIVVSPPSNAGDDEANATGAAEPAGFDADSLVELTTLAQTVQSAADDGSLESSLKMPVVLMAIATTDPSAPMANIVNDATTATTTAAPAANATTVEAGGPGALMPDIDQDGSELLPILIGAIGGAFVGLAMMGFGIYAKMRWAPGVSTAVIPAENAMLPLGQS